ncbi:MAG: hypothetical protein ACYTG6_12840 [Planctomycetota bacterium]
MKSRPRRPGGGTALLLATCLALVVPPGLAEESPTVPVELGRVAWIRDYGEAVATAKRTDQAMLILFQEVPG